jgi:hypothetical protein
VPQKAHNGRSSEFFKGLSAKKGNGPGFFERSLKRFLPIHLGEAKDQGLELSESQAASFQGSWSEP